MSHFSHMRTHYGSLASYLVHRAENEQVELRAVLASIRDRNIAALARGDWYAAEVDPRECPLWDDLQVEQELNF